MVIEPSSAKPLGSVTTKRSASSAKDCAGICFGENCTAAGFQPAAEGSNLADTGVCLLSFDDSSSLSDCTDEDTVQEYETSQPILILCVTCGKTESTTIAAE